MWLVFALVTGQSDPPRLTSQNPACILKEARLYHHIIRGNKRHTQHRPNRSENKQFPLQIVNCKLTLNNCPTIFQPFSMSNYTYYCSKFPLFPFSQHVQDMSTPPRRPDCPCPAVRCWLWPFVSVGPSPPLASRPSFAVALPAPETRKRPLFHWETR